jgi:hypothetical protein
MEPYEKMLYKEVAQGVCIDIEYSMRHSPSFIGFEKAPTLSIQAGVPCRAVCERFSASEM